MVLSFLLKTQSGDQGFSQINSFYLLGYMSEILSLHSIEPQAIYNMEDEQKPLYNFRIFEFFAHQSLRNPQDVILCKFAVDSLEFL